MTTILRIVAAGAAAWTAAANAADVATDQGRPISAAFPFESKFAEVHGSRMHYVEVGEGDPILFVHGNPTSSYLWRNVIPEVESRGRCIAPDLIGMGQSDKPDIDYTFFDHARYLDGFIESLDLNNVTLVLHDWGTGLGFHYAARHPENVKAIVFMEAMVRIWDSFDDMAAIVQPFFKSFRTEGVGEDLLIKQNVFIEQMLPGGIQRTLTDEEMNVYRAPYLEEAHRKPLWAWPQQAPIGGEPTDVVDAVNAYSAWLTESDVPKLMFTVDPGIILTQAEADWAKEHMPNLDAIHLGPGIHFIQEDYPYTIGMAISDWLDERD